jgi:glycosyltransferase involved in cell wall biosynthesis
MDIRTMQMEKRAWKDKLRGQFASIMGALANRFVDGQTAITRRMADALHIPVKKLWGTWPSGVNVEEFSSAIQSRCWPKGGGPIQLVYIGTLAPGRDLMPLCRAVEDANRVGMCFELSLVGDGDDYENLAAFAAKTDGKVRLPGRFPHDQMPAVLSKMHVGVLPFPDREEFRVSSPIKLFEYMAAGMPILATRIPCHTDVVGVDSFVFWAENSTVEGLTIALRVLWQERESLSSRGGQAARLVLDHTWAASAQKLALSLVYGLTTSRGGQ